MPWIRPNDVFERIDTAGTGAEATCLIQRKHRFIVQADHDAAIEFSRDLKDLINKHVVSGNLVPVENRLQKHAVAVLEDLLAFLASDTGNEDCGIHFQISPTLTVRGTEGHESDLVESVYGRFVDRTEDSVRDLESEVGDQGGEIQITHNTAPISNQQEFSDYRPPSQGAVQDNDQAS